MGLLIKPDGTTKTVEPKNGKFTLDELQVLVGGYIEQIASYRGVVLANEEGKLLNLEPNEKATSRFLMWYMESVPVIDPCGEHVLRGNILFCDEGEIE